MRSARARRAGRKILIAAVLAGAFVGGCRKKAPPAPAVEPTQLEARIGQLADSLRALDEAEQELALRVDSLEALQSQLLATRGKATSRRRADSGGGGTGAGGAAARAGADSIVVGLDRQKVIFENYEMLQRQGFQGDTIPAFLARKYGVDSITVEAIARRGQEEGW